MEAAAVDVDVERRVTTDLNRLATDIESRMSRKLGDTPTGLGFATNPTGRDVDREILAKRGSNREVANILIRAEILDGSVLNGRFRCSNTRLFGYGRIVPDGRSERILATRLLGNVTADFLQCALKNTCIGGFHALIDFVKPTTVAGLHELPAFRG